MDLTCISARLSFRYADSYSHLDCWERLGLLRLTPAKQTRLPGMDLSDGGSYVRFARLPAGLSAKQRKQWARAIEDSLSYSNCRHEWDCCGCATTRARVTLSGRTALVRQHVSFNY